VIRKLIFIFIFSFVWSSGWCQDNVTIEMYISPDTIGLDGQAMLSIVVKSGRQNLPAPQMPNLSMFDAVSSGTSTNISIVNGAVESSQAYNYILYPKQQGTFNIKPAFIVLDRKRYESNEVTLTVLKQGVGTPKGTQEAAQDSQTGETRDVFLVAQLDKKRAFVNQQVTLTIKFYNAVRLLSQPDYTPPQTSDFWSESIEPQRSYTETINGRRYNVIELNTALFPTRPGELTIGSAMASVQVPDNSAGRSRDPFRMFDSFFDRGVTRTVRTRPLTLDVQPLPAEGKPSGYSGTVGDFAISSTADKTTVEVNQPITVTYKINGTGNIKTVAEPKIEETNDFRVYRASSDEKVSKLQGIVGGTKIYEETYIPKRAGNLVIPAVELSFFDPRAKKYKTISSKPINITATAASLNQYAELPIPNVAGRVIDPNAKDIRYIKTDSGRLEKEKPLILLTPLYLTLNGLPVLLLAFVWVASRRRERLASDIGYARSRAAKRMARKRLGKARKIAGSANAAEFFAEIRMALFSYVADKLNISPHGMTGDQLLAIVTGGGADEDTVKDLKNLLRKADFAQYSSAKVSAEDIKDSLDKAENIMVKLEGIRLEQAA